LRNRASVIIAEFFRAPCITMQSLGKIVQRALAPIQNFFSMSYIAPTARSKLLAGTPKKWLGTNNIVRTKSHTGSKFSKITLWQLYTRGTAVVHPYYSFSLRRQMAPQQNAQFITVFLVNIAAFSFSIMHRFGRSF